MKIAKVELIPCVTRNEDPEWRFALSSASPVYHGFVFKLVSDDGLIGLGYAGRGQKLALDACAEILSGQDPFNYEKIFLTLAYERCSAFVIYSIVIPRPSSKNFCTLASGVEGVIGLPVHMTNPRHFLPACAWRLISHAKSSSLPF